jgi:hypothetical protein
MKNRKNLTAYGFAFKMLESTYLSKNASDFQYEQSYTTLSKKYAHEGTKKEVIDLVKHAISLRR